MKKIVKTDGKELVVSLNDISQFSGVKEKSIHDLLVRNRKEFKVVGLSLPKECDFKSLTLKEHQTTLLMMFMKNTPQVKAFKVKLVEEFFKMREYIQNNKIKLSENVFKSLDEILPTASFGELNKNGIPKTKLVRSYLKEDLNDENTLKYIKLNELKKMRNSLIRDDVELDIEILELELNKG